MVDLPGRIGGILNYFETAYGMIILGEYRFRKNIAVQSWCTAMFFMCSALARFRANEREKRSLSQTDHHMKCTPNARLFVQHLGCTSCLRHLKFLLLFILYRFHRTRRPATEDSSVYQDPNLLVP